MSRCLCLCLLAGLCMLPVPRASAFTEETLPNGVRVVAVEQTSLDGFCCTALVRCPSTPDGDAPRSRKVLARAAFLGYEGRVCEEAVSRARQFSEQGGSFAAEAQPDHIVLEVSGAPRAADLGFAMLSDALLHPPVDDETLAEVKLPPDDPGRGRDQATLSLLLWQAGQALYPGSFVQSERAATEPALFEAVRGEFGARFAGAGVVLVVVGPQPEAEALARLRSIAEALPARALAPVAEAPDVSAPGGSVSEQVREMLGLNDPAHEPPVALRSRVTESDQGGQLALLALAYAAPPMGTEERACAELAQELLAGSEGRIAREPRLRQLSMAAGTMLLGDGAQSRLIAYAATPKPWTLETLRAELALDVERLEMLSPLEPELDAARARLLGKKALAVRSPSGRAYELARCALAGGDVASLASDPLAAVRSATADQFRAFAATHLRASQAAVAVTLPRLSYMGGSATPVRGAP